MDAYASDLFFNLDHSGNMLPDDDDSDAAAETKGFDRAKLLEEAKWFCGAISAISGILLTPQEVVNDFIARV